MQQTQHLCKARSIPKPSKPLRPHLLCCRSLAGVACPSSHLGHHHLLHPNEHPHALERPDDGGLQEDTRVVRGLAHYKWHKAAPDWHHNPRIVRQHNGFPKKNHPENRSQLCVRVWHIVMGHACAVRFGCYKVSKRGCCLSQKVRTKFPATRSRRMLPSSPDIAMVILTYDQLNLNALNFGFEWVKKNIKRIKDVRPKKMDGLL